MERTDLATATDMLVIATIQSSRAHDCGAERARCFAIVEEITGWTIAEIADAVAVASKARRGGSSDRRARGHERGVPAHPRVQAGA